MSLWWGKGDEPGPLGAARTRRHRAVQAPGLQSPPQMPALVALPRGFSQTSPFFLLEQFHGKCSSSLHLQGLIGNFEEIHLTKILVSQ